MFQANVDGFVSFTSAGTIYDVDKDFNQLDVAVICVFCADFFPYSGSTVWFRLSTAAADLQVSSWSLMPCQPHSVISGVRGQSVMAQRLESSFANPDQLCTRQNRRSCVW